MNRQLLRRRVKSYIKSMLDNDSFRHYGVMFIDLNDDDRIIILKKTYERAVKLINEPNDIHQKNPNYLFNFYSRRYFEKSFDDCRTYYEKYQVIDASIDYCITKYFENNERKS